MTEIKYFMDGELKSFEVDNRPEVLRDAIVAVVEKFGADHVYRPVGNEQCRYIDPNDAYNPCAFGAALTHMGVPVEWLSAEVRAETSIIYVLMQLGFDGPVLEISRRAQSVQDEGGAWGEVRDIMVRELTV